MTLAAPRFHLGHRPGLDGIRGVAILLVLLVHGGILEGGFGFIGVNTFFVLSGFLITCLLIEEYDRTSNISFRQFYLRRALRLLPALITMLLLFVAFSFVFDPYKRALRETYEALSALFYFSNWAGIYHIGRHISLAHTWSLSIEEQFYIVWPAILLFALSKTTRSSLLCWITLATVAAVLVRISLWVGGTTNVSGNILPENPDRLVAGTDTRADSLLLGCFAGVLISSNMLPQKIWFRNLLRGAAMAAGPGLLALGVCWITSPFMICAGWLLASVLAAALILHLVSADPGPLHYILQNSFLVFVGEISYGLYVWHFPILKAMEQHQLPRQYMSYLLLVVPVVLCSYYFIERPCLKFKRRFQKV